jgi:hypothetical protein
MLLISGPGTFREFQMLLISGPGTFREFQMLLISGPGLGHGDHNGAQEP